MSPRSAGHRAIAAIFPMKKQTRYVRLLSAFFALSLGTLGAASCSKHGAPASPAASDTADLSGKTDASIRRVLEVVSKHQVRQLAAGDYAPAGTLDALKAARLPEGVQWDYPWGVTLYGVQRASDFLNDKSPLEFVYAHNQAAARYHAFLLAAKDKIRPADEAWSAYLRNRKQQPL